MAAKLWEGCLAHYRDANDNAASGALAYFYIAGTSTPLAVFADPELNTQRAHPTAASSAGRFPSIYLPYVSYRFRVTDAAGVTIQDFDGIANPPPLDDGGGGGVTVSADQIFQTGDTIFLERTGARAGWVRDNGRTIGNAASGAAERANDDCADLYSFYWNTFPDAICPVTGGRGPSADSDFAAGKPIQTLDKRGRVAVGLDDMGNGAANRIQVSTTITTTAGSATALVASASGLALGMAIIASTIPVGTTIAGISGTTITLSSGVGVTAGTAQAVRFSLFSNAQTPGVTGGVSTLALQQAELAAHTHTGTTDTSGAHAHSGTTSSQTSNHSHIYQLAGGASSFDRSLSGPTGTALTSSSAGSASTGNEDSNHQHTIATNTAGDHTHAFTTASAGSGLPHSNIQPAILGTWYRKL